MYIQHGICPLSNFLSILVAVPVQRQRPDGSSTRGHPCLVCPPPPHCLGRCGDVRFETSGRVLAAAKNPPRAPSHPPIQRLSLHGVDGAPPRNRVAYQRRSHVIIVVARPAFNSRRSARLGRMSGPGGRWGTSKLVNPGDGILCQFDGSENRKCGHPATSMRNAIRERQETSEIAGNKRTSDYALHARLHRLEIHAHWFPNLALPLKNHLIVFLYRIEDNSIKFLWRELPPPLTSRRSSPEGELEEQTLQLPENGLCRLKPGSLPQNAIISW